MNRAVDDVIQDLRDFDFCPDHDPGDALPCAMQREYPLTEDECDALLKHIDTLTAERDGGNLPARSEAGYYVTVGQGGVRPLVEAEGSTSSGLVRFEHDIAAPWWGVGG